MALAIQPRSLRFDERTEEQLRILSQLTGTPISDLIRKYVIQGIAADISPAALQKLVSEFTAKTATLQALSMESTSESQDDESQVTGVSS